MMNVQSQNGRSGKGGGGGASIPFMDLLVYKIIEPQREKTYLRTCAPSEDSSPPRGLGEQGNKAVYFGGTREQKSKTEGTRGTKANLGKNEHRKSRF